ncbi:hypothetical protein LTR70_004530 [Exophiala xenobiotica]|uniref:Uncharacterized protein n=1 Tax=Lithohypha guttulata TaxID=1690604 RepID=A0ABR0KQU5_9EURO|nr:hypothetical protein LTR24_000460 [Lithohypha guttulata]KAK5320447.1 hypothetical protein LTR70_004530 [Exophiala xenobiotica]
MAPDEKHTFSYLAPIPTYEEATSSRPSSPNTRLGPEEISDDAERQGLLGGEEQTVPPSNYAPPTVESERPSLDSLDGLGEDEEAEVRREMQEMDIEDPADSDSSRSLLSHRFKRFTSFTNSLPSLTLPSFGRFLPSWRPPRIDWQALDNNRAMIIGRLFGIMIIGGLVYVLVASDIVGFGNRRNMYMFKPESIRNYVMDGIQESDNIPKYLQRVTQYPHIAGSEGNYVLGEWVEEEFKAGGLSDVHMERFDVYLNYPRKDGRRVAIVEPADKEWEAKLEEDAEETYVFHGHSASGDVTGHLVYANYGSRQDFERLKSKNIPLEGAIVLVRYYGTEGDRALKVKAAEMAGAAGCIIYSDPAQDGHLQGPVYPNGRFMPQDGVQRGAVSLMSWVVGDVLSPGFASTPGEQKRIAPSESAGLNKIPSIPLSWRDAQQLLKALQDHGERLEGDWVGDSAVEYWTGDASSPKVNLKNIQDEEQRQPIYNILGRINGFEAHQKRVIVGNHRDAWCTGAADPGSGTAVMLDVIRQLGVLQQQGWAPLRTIEFASWDGEEYNLIGSTEHVEGRIDDMRQNAIAYINLDVAVSGVDFHASGSPLLEKALKNTIARVADPGTNRSLHETWDRNGRSLEGLGAGSDYVAFQDIAGVPSIDLSFEGERFPYHSCYDSYDWMQKFGDPGWSYHKAMAQVLVLLILELSDHALVSLDLPAYSKAIASYVDKLDKDVNGQLSDKNNKQAKLDVQSLRSAAQILDSTAGRFENFDNEWHSEVFATGGFESSILNLKRLERNMKLEMFEKMLTDEAGLVNRTQFKHVIFGPQKWSGYDEAFFPGIRDWVEAGDMPKAQEEVKKVADIIIAAAEQL